MLKFINSAQKDTRPYTLQNYPNPFSGHTKIPFWIPKSDLIWLKVYLPNGKIVFEQAKFFEKGEQAFDFNPFFIKGGNHWFYQIGGSDWVETRQMMRLPEY